jgi:hypothetical protein
MPPKSKEESNMDEGPPMAEARNDSIADARREQDSYVFDSLVAGIVLNEAKAAGLAPTGPQLAAITRAAIAESNFVRKAIVAGQMMQEKAAELVWHQTGSFSIRDRAARQIFSKWLTRHLPKMPRGVAACWMTAASRVMRILLELQSSPQPDAPVFINTGAETILISDVLAGRADVDAELQTLRGTFETFLADKELRGDAACWLDGFEPDSYDREGNVTKRGRPVWRPPPA